MRGLRRFLSLLGLGVVVSLLAWLAPAASPSQAQGCAELLWDGGFELGGAWELGITPLTPEYVTYTRHSGYRSLALGITKGGNQKGFSSARQSVVIPAGATSVTLSFWAYTMVEGLAGADAFQLLLLNPDGTTLYRLWSSSSDSRLWNPMSFDVTRWRGRAVQVYFNVTNDGVGGTAGMFLDDVSMLACPGPVTTPIPTGASPSPPTATKTATAPAVTPAGTKTATPPTATASKTATPPAATGTKTATPPAATRTGTAIPPTVTKTRTGLPPTAVWTRTPTPVPPPSATTTPIVIPGGSQADRTATAVSGPPSTRWPTASATAAVSGPSDTATRPPSGTPGPAGPGTLLPDLCRNLVKNGEFAQGLTAWEAYAAGPLSPQVVEVPGNAGGTALRLGTQTENLVGNSTVQQTVSLPAEAQGVTLTFRIITWAESPSGADVQEVLVFDAGQEVIATPWSGLADERVWRTVTTDLSAYRGQEVTLFFNVFNDGAGGKTALFVDDVRLVACPPLAASGAGAEAGPTGPLPTRVALTVWPNPTWADFAPQTTRIVLPSTPSAAMVGPAPMPVAPPSPTAEPRATESLSDWLERVMSPVTIAFGGFLILLLLLLVIWRLRE